MNELDKNPTSANYIKYSHHDYVMDSGLVFLYIELCEPNQESGPIGRDFRAGAQRMKTSRQSTSCTLITAELARDLKIPGTPPQQLSAGVGTQSAPGYIQAACNSGFG